MPIKLSIAIDTSVIGTVYYFHEVGTKLTTDFRGKNSDNEVGYTEKSVTSRLEIRGSTVL